MNDNIITMSEFEKLFEKNKPFVLFFDKRICLSFFYIGKTKAVDLLYLLHQNDVYNQSVKKQS